MEVTSWADVQRRFRVSCRPVVHWRSIGITSNRKNRRGERLRRARTRGETLRLRLSIAATAGDVAENLSRLGSIKTASASLAAVQRSTQRIREHLEDPWHVPEDQLDELRWQLTMLELRIQGFRLLSSAAHESVLRQRQFHRLRKTEDQHGTLGQAGRCRFGHEHVSGHHPRGDQRSDASAHRASQLATGYSAGARACTVLDSVFLVMRTSLNPTLVVGAGIGCFRLHRLCVEVVGGPVGQNDGVGAKTKGGSGTKVVPCETATTRPRISAPAGIITRPSL